MVLLLVLAVNAEYVLLDFENKKLTVANCFSMQRSFDSGHFKGC